MEDDELLTIRRLVFRGNIMKKRVMHLPVLSLHSQDSHRDRIKDRRKKKSEDKMREKLSINNLLHIIQQPEPCSRYMMTTINRSVFSRDQLFSSNRSIQMIGNKKRQASLPSQETRGQLYQAMKIILEKKKQQIKKSLSKSREKQYLSSIKKGQNESQRPYMQEDNSQRLVASKIKIFPSSSCRKVVPFNIIRQHFRKSTKEDRKNLLLSTEKLKSSPKYKTQRGEEDLTGWNNFQNKERIIEQQLVVDNAEYESLHF